MNIEIGSVPFLSIRVSVVTMPELTAMIFEVCEHCALYDCGFSISLFANADSNCPSTRTARFSDFHKFLSEGGVM